MEDRALNDTRYMAKLLKNHLEQSLAVKNGVQTRNGALTAHLRGVWGFAEKDRGNDRHHALDAIVIACSTQSMVQRVAEWHRDRRTPEKPALPSRGTASAKMRLPQWAAYSSAGCPCAK